jgi:hypothetical protein
LQYRCRAILFAQASRELIGGGADTIAHTALEHGRALVVDTANIDATLGCIVRLIKCHERFQGQERVFQFGLSNQLFRLLSQRGFANPTHGLVHFFAVHKVRKCRQTADIVAGTEFGLPIGVNLDKNGLVGKGGGDRFENGRHHATRTARVGIKIHHDGQASFRRMFSQ